MPAAKKASRLGWACALAVAVLLAGPVLGQDKDEKKEEKKAETRTVELHTVKTDLPAAWKEEEPSNNFRQLQFRAPRAEGDDADAEGYVSIMRAAGSLEQNLGRWKARFKDPKGGEFTTVERDGFKIHSTELAGTYIQRKGPMDPNPKEMPGYKLLVGVIELSDTTVYILLSGPAKTIDANKAGWEAMLKKVRR